MALHIGDTIPEIPGTVRTTFLVDEQGIISHIMEGRAVDTGNHAVQILGIK